LNTFAGVVLVANADGVGDLSLLQRDDEIEESEYYKSGVCLNKYFKNKYN